MKKYQKTVFAALSTMVMFLAPVQAVFADEVSTTTNLPSQEVQAQQIDIFAQNPLREYFDGGYSTDIYLTGSITITFSPRALGEYVINVEDMTGTLKGSGRVIVSDYSPKSIRLDNLRGYHKIVAYSPNGVGGAYDIHY
ncbi:hypothetical protein G7L40_26975 (plasmid) [Paenibacillus polymyxa]|uniref:Uncharacterized protein n=1 Tax=Paenibacillus polymyxa TaxID=1406 RepID=A0A379LV09_PAEPO|nr:hypothetical protein [Paenibacillus polymyxa]MBE7901123.1 hypothetical protein [Paenibacillus polymyxa]MBG9764532.1 hypothetical protein [Paenibacillus polymyxa]MCC3261774.1 hypothetical protein [Paenibacillus polymyxa]QPK56319.1 hypothetical protein G7035_27055 [Paenibacillus polymyxa]QPK61336.1 hypothetical protein G7L40_26975 [Paenibacillus polymyxa]